MFLHFSIMMIVFKKKNKKFDQKEYDFLFHTIENNLRELGFGDVSVNKKMKEFNKILYDILLKLDLNKGKKNTFKIDERLIIKYFNKLKDVNGNKYKEFESYFTKFYDFCFDLSLDNMIRDIINFKI
jgi:cytochrome b pre-mRNA-processing protein 3